VAKGGLFSIEIAFVVCSREGTLEAPGRKIEGRGGEKENSSSWSDQVFVTLRVHMRGGKTGESFIR